ncbi:unnamed protein product [Nezara viridula]|uniref:Uncharacterized protein n=1 Tax=Nezara viridula TaxID=85310 RepID=A0A9P0H0L9_NEZVI|nr:unnamed protein product [Nezara viridula]
MNPNANTLPSHSDAVLLPFSDTVRYLGLLIDRPLTWNPHARPKRLYKDLMLQLLCLYNKEYSEECVFNENIEENHYNSYSSAKYSNARRTLYLGLNKRGQGRMVMTRGGALGKQSAYARVLTQPVQWQAKNTTHCAPAVKVVHTGPPRCKLRMRRPRRRKRKRCREEEICRKRKSRLRIRHRKHRGAPENEDEFLLEKEEEEEDVTMTTEDEEDHTLADSSE